MRAVVPAVCFVVMCCAGPIGTMRPGPSVPASMASVVDESTPSVATFDGSYRGKIWVTSSFGSGKDVSSWCASPGQPSITVTDGQFTYAVPHPNVPGNTTPVYPATMAEDGTFRGQIVAGSITGRVSGTHMEGQIDGSACQYAFSAEKV